MQLKCALKLFGLVKPRTDVGPSWAPESLRLAVQAGVEAKLRPFSKCFLSLALICWITHFVFSILMLSHIFLLLTAIGLTAFGLYLLALAAGQELGMKMLTKSIGHDLS